MRSCRSWILTFCFVVRYCGSWILAISRGTCLVSTWMWDRLETTGVIFTFLVGYRVSIFITVCVISISCVRKVHAPVSVCLPGLKNTKGGGLGSTPPPTPTTRPLPLSAYIVVNKTAVFLQKRPYHGENTSFRSITEVKQHRGRLVLGWVTAWEHRVSLSFSLVGCRLFTGTSCSLELDTHILNAMNWAARARPDCPGPTQPCINLADLVARPFQSSCQSVVQFSRSVASHQGRS